MKRTLSISGLELHVFTEGNVTYKTWTTAMNGGYAWGVTDLSDNRTVGGWEATESAAKAIIDHPADALAAAPSKDA